MVATVNASTTAGVVITPDNSGVLAFQSSSATALTIDASQNATFVGTATATKLIPTGASAAGNGMYLPAANSLGLSTNGTEAMRIDSSSNMLVGTTSATFTYTGSSTATAKQVISTSGYDCLNLISTAANPGIDFSQPNSASTIYRYANITGVMTTTTAGSESGALTFATGNAGANSTERMRITSAGVVGINTTRATARLCIDAGCESDYTGLAIKDTDASTGGSIVAFTNSTNNGIGSISHNATNTVAYNTSSDYRMKEDVQPMTCALNKVALLKPVTYKWREEFGGGDGQGFIAHELQEVVPDCVHGTKDAVDADGNPKYQGIDTSFLVATLTAAIQELKAINDTQAATITTLTARIVALENR